MAKNKKFLGYAVLLCILGIVFMFLYSGLQNDQINIIQAFITEKGGGWKASSTQLPMTVGNFICIMALQLQTDLTATVVQHPVTMYCFLSHYLL